MCLRLNAYFRIKSIFNTGMSPPSFWEHQKKKKLNYK